MIAEISIGTVVSFIVFWIVALPLLFWLETDKGGEFILRYIYPELSQRKKKMMEEADKEWKELMEKLDKDNEK